MIDPYERSHTKYFRTMAISLLLHKHLYIWPYRLLQSGFLLFLILLKIIFGSTSRCHNSKMDWSRHSGCNRFWGHRCSLLQFQSWYFAMNRKTGITINGEHLDWLLTRSWQIILFFLPIILFFNSQTFCLLFLLKVALFLFYHLLFSILVSKVLTFNDD